MTKRMFLSVSALTLVGAIAFATAPAPAPSPADDIAAVKKNSAEFGAAWNRHDGRALGALWAKDGDLIDPWGVTSVGREAVEKFFTEQHQGTGKLAKVTYDLKHESVRMIGDAALSDWDVVLTGLTDPDGKAMGPQFHRVVIVSAKEGGKWRIAAARPGLPTPVKDGSSTPSMPAMPAKPTK